MAKCPILRADLNKRIIAFCTRFGFVVHIPNQMSGFALLKPDNTVGIGLCCLKSSSSYCFKGRFESLLLRVGDLLIQIAQHNVAFAWQADLHIFI